MVCTCSQGSVLHACQQVQVTVLSARNDLTRYVWQHLLHQEEHEASTCRGAEAEQAGQVPGAVQAVRRKLPPPPEPLSQSAAEAASCQDFMTPEDYVARDEVFKVLPDHPLSTTKTPTSAWLPVLHALRLSYMSESPPCRSRLLQALHCPETAELFCPACVTVWSGP